MGHHVNLAFFSVRIAWGRRLTFFTHRLEPTGDARRILSDLRGVHASTPGRLGRQFQNAEVRYITAALPEVCASVVHKRCY
jgi:hypothetical protein